MANPLFEKGSTMVSIEVKARKVNEGQRFGRLTALCIGGQDKRGKSKWLCECDCGNQVLVIADNLRRGNTQSCGCRKLDMLAARLLVHGHSRKRTRTAEYRAWHHFIGRCCTPTDKQYADYGGRGIRVCQRWRESFQAFLDDMGLKPTRIHSIDRKDNDAHYSCGHCDECLANGWTANCRWATPLVQANNRRRRRVIGA